MHDCWTTILWESWTALVLCTAAVLPPGSTALTYPAVLFPGLALSAAVPLGWALWAMSLRDPPLPPETLLEQPPRRDFSGVAELLV